jgi:hypothetical protein
LDNTENNPKHIQSVSGFKVFCLFF